MRARLTWLSEAEKEAFVVEALGLLERVGVELRGSRALAALAEQEPRSTRRRASYGYRPSWS